MSEKKPYYRKRKGSAKTKPSEVEVNATSLDTKSSDLGVVVQQKPKRKRYNRKPKSRLATEAEAWAVTQQSISDTMIIDYTANNTIDWTDAVRSTAAERGIDQMGFPTMPKGFSPAEDATSKNSTNTVVKEAMQKHNEVMRDKIKYNSNTDTEDEAKRYASKSDHMLREHRLLSAIALGIVFLGMIVVMSIWWMLAHN